MGPSHEVDPRPDPVLSHERATGGAAVAQNDGGPGPADPAAHPAWPAWIAQLRARVLRRAPAERIEARRDVEAALLRVIAADAGWDPGDHHLRLLDGEDEPHLPPPPAELLGPDVLGAVHEALLEPAQRRTTGAHYTPPPLASALVSWALDGWEPPGGAAPRVVDLAVGGGAFLLASARWARARGCPVAEVLAGLGGVDLDPAAVAVAEASLVAWGRAEGWDGAGPGPSLSVGDGSDVEAIDPGAALRMGTVDVVVGNPPFLGQLGRDTARDRSAAARLRARYGSAVGGYVDEAAVFLRVACEWPRSGGRVVLIQPESVLGARDAEGVRAAVADRADLVGLWVAGEPAFAAAVDVCAPVLEVRGSSPSTGPIGSGPLASGAPESTPTDLDPRGTESRGDRRRASAGHQADVPGRGAAPVPRTVEVPGAVAHEVSGADGVGAAVRGAVGGQALVARADGVGVRAGASVPRPTGPAWAPLLAEARGVPVVALGPGAGEVGDMATATAGFRQHFYALAPHLSEHPDVDAPAAVAGDLAPVLTTGLVDPVTFLWGTRRARIAGMSWSRPMVDLGAVAGEDPTVAEWLRSRLQPKVVVAPQTRVVEAAVDAGGRFVPGVPLVSVELIHPAADPEPDLWLLVAALSAPPVTAWALSLAAGTARHRDALRLSARQVRTVPLPTDRATWEAAAARLRAGRPLAEVGPDLTAAYGLDPDHPVTDWWRARLPAPRR